jgi:DNA-binding HxlR family transcriptional regulator
MSDVSATHSFCPHFHRAAELIGKRWSGAVVRELLQGTRRFNALQAAIPGLSARMLTERLHELEAEGVLVRSVSRGPPIQVAYALTPKGRALGKVVDALTTWAHAWTPLRPVGSRTRAPVRRARPR